MIRSLVLTPIALAALTSTALAHFNLHEPKPDRKNDPQGKAPPCGDTGTPTTDVTNYQPGQMITVTIDEFISHPGQYRVSLAQNAAALPPEPPVTPGGGRECGSAPIDPTPTLPVLADGLFVNLVPANGKQSVQIKLPDGMTCTNCVLQVLQFMSDHDENPIGGCYYHHCAKVNVSASAPDAGPPGPDGGNNGGPDAGNGNTGAGGGCSTTGGAGLPLALGLVGLATRRRRR